MTQPLTPVSFSNARTLVTAARDLCELYNACGAAACIAELVADLAEYGATAAGRDDEVVTNWEIVHDAAVLVRETVFPNGLDWPCVDSFDSDVFAERLAALAQLLD